MVPIAIPALSILYYLECIIYVPSCYFLHPRVFPIVCALCVHFPRVAAASRMRQDRQDRPCGCLPLFGKSPICGYFWYADSCRNAQNKTKHAALVRIEFAVCGSSAMRMIAATKLNIYVSVLLADARFEIVFECSNCESAIAQILEMVSLQHTLIDNANRTHQHDCGSNQRLFACGSGPLLALAIFGLRPNFFQNIKLDLGSLPIANGFPLCNPAFLFCFRCKFRHWVFVTVIEAQCCAQAECDRSLLFLLDWLQVPFIPFNFWSDYKLHDVFEQFLVSWCESVTHASWEMQFEVEAHRAVSHMIQICLNLVLSSSLLVAKSWSDHQACDERAVGKAKVRWCQVQSPAPVFTDSRNGKWVLSKFDLLSLTALHLQVRMVFRNAAATGKDAPFGVIARWFDRDDVRVNGLAIASRYVRCGRLAQDSSIIRCFKATRFAMLSVLDAPRARSESRTKALSPLGAKQVRKHCKSDSLRSKQRYQGMSRRASEASDAGLLVGTD